MNEDFGENVRWFPRAFSLSSIPLVIFYVYSLLNLGSGAVVHTFDIIRKVDDRKIHRCKRTFRQKAFISGQKDKGIYIDSVVEMEGRKFSQSVELLGSGFSPRVAYFHIDAADLLVVLEWCLQINNT